MQLERRNRLTLRSTGAFSGAILWRQQSVVIVLRGFVDVDPFDKAMGRQISHDSEKSQ